MSDFQTIPEDQIRLSGNVSLAVDDETVQCVYSNGTDANFALGHIFAEPGIMKLFFNEKNGQTGETHTRTFSFDPIQLIEGITKVVLLAKSKKEDSFI